MDDSVRRAVQALWDMAASDATPEQIREIATAYQVETWKLEGAYFEEIERAAND